MAVTILLSKYTVNFLYGMIITIVVSMQLVARGWTANYTSMLINILYSTRVMVTGPDQG